MLKKLLILLIVISSVCEKSKAQTYVAILDAYFVIYLQGLIPAAMNGNQMDTTSILVTTTTHSINCSSRSIANLFGVQYFTSLTYLECSGNYLTSLPALPNSLTFLDCYNNHLTSLPALPNSLQSLYCNHNNIACFPSFPSSIQSGQFNIDPNLYNCLPNYIAAMNAADLAMPLCTTGNSNGCAVATTSIQQVAGINEQVTVYPNPASSSLQVSFSGNIGQVTGSNNQVLITDMLGNAIYHSTLNAQHNTINVSDLSEGVYQFIIHNDPKGAPAFTITKKVVIVR
ncbi:MAG TPA: T9SS type A sorting domain-containing protein [Bacteroidia bacterium]